MLGTIQAMTMNGRDNMLGVLITAETWSGVWIGLEGATLQIFNDTLYETLPWVLKIVEINHDIRALRLQMKPIDFERAFKYFQANGSEYIYKLQFSENKYEDAYDDYERAMSVVGARS